MLSPVKVWRRQKEIKNLIGKKGSVISWTKIFTPPRDFKENAPYFVVLVEFQDGKRVFGQLIEFSQETIPIGMRVVSVLRRARKVSQEDVIVYGLKFKKNDENNFI